MCHIVGIEPQFKNILLNGPYVLMTDGQRKPEGQWTAAERKAANLDQQLKSLILKKSLTTAIPMAAAFISTSIVQDFKDSHDDEEDLRSSQEYMNDLEEEFHERALLAKSKRFFKKGTQRFSGAKATDETQYHKCGRKDHFPRDCFSKTSVLSYSSPFQNNTQPKFFSSTQQKPELRPSKDFEAKYNKVKANLALLNSSALTSKSSMVKNKGLVTEAYERDDEYVSSNDHEMVEVKVLMALADDENVVVGKEIARNGEWVKIFSFYLTK
ncbi:hypothetical protein Tco_1411215 [Tanacetum coccineum]